MEQELTRDDVLLFANAVQSLGFSRNISLTTHLVNTPPHQPCAIYKHNATGRRVVVWPISNDEDAHTVGALADRHGFTFVQYGRPQPVRAAPTSANRTPLQADADNDAGRLRALATEAANNSATAAARGDDKTAHMYHDDAEALAYGAACITARARRHG